MRATFTLFIMLFLISCATTKISSFKDPAFASKKYTSLLVITSYKSLADRNFTETKICEEFAKISITCKRGIDVFLPTRTYTDEEWVNAFYAENVEAFISIQLTDSYSNQAYIPQTSTTTGNISAYGNTAYYSGSTNTYGGYTVNKPVEEYKITLIDGQTGKQAMAATGKTAGGAGVDSKTMSTSLAKKIVATLVANELLPVSEEVLLEARQKKSVLRTQSSLDGY